MLEDDFTYVLRKAFKGLALAPGEAALRAGLAESDVLALSRGQFSTDTARRLAPVLGLDPDALATHDRYHPRDLADPRIQRLDLPFGSEQVNAWCFFSGATRLLFDTGNDPHSCRDALASLGTGDPQRVFITHGHGDHVGGVATFQSAGIPRSGPEFAGAENFSANDAFDFDGFTVRGVDLSGHYVPSVGYRIEQAGFPPVLVTGDALFAGSIGGCNTPALYQLALRNLRAALAPLPDETLLLPGHGPATTLGEERTGNPFL